MSRSFHVNRSRFRNCSREQLEEMANDEYSEFMEWVYKIHVKKIVIEKRKFKKIFTQLLEDDSLSEKDISKLDEREYFYKVLHSKMFKNDQENNT